jgi:DNA-binding CsgD family transcriptional regulator
MIMVVIFTIIIICAFISFESAVKVLWLNNRTAVNIIYALFAFDYALTCAAFGFFIYSPNMELAWLWHRVMTIPILALPFLIFHFSILATVRKKAAQNPFVYCALYACALILIVQTFRGFVIKGIYLTPWGWEHEWDKDSIWSILCSIAELAGFFASMALFTWRGIRSEKEREKKQALLICFAFLAGFAGCAISLIGAFSDDPVYHTIVSNLSMVILITPFIACVRYSIYRFRLMTLTHEQLASGLMNGINSPVMLADAEGNLVFQNMEAQRMIKSAGLGRIKTIFDFFPAADTLKNEMNSLAGGIKWNNFINCTVLMPNGACSAFTLNLMGITNEDRDFIGVLISAFEQPSIREFQSRYEITDRQVEIIFLSVSGLSNKEISGRLGISERTVEHHHFNIYNKLGINNKIELHNLARQFRIVSQ